MRQLIRSLPSPCAPRLSRLRRVGLGLIPLAMAAGLVLGAAGSASASSPVPIPPLVKVDPKVQANVCGNGVGLIGSGTTANCAGSQTTPASPNGGGGLLDVGPTVQADACGNGVGLIGTGSAATCGANQTAAAGAGDPVGVAPEIQLGVCGNGVGVLGAGTTAQCSNSTSTGGNPVQNPGGTTGGGTGGSNGGTTASAADAGSGSSVLDAVTAPIGAINDPLGRGTLPFTGGNTLLTGIAGMTLAGIGAAMLRLRRFGLVR